MYSEKSGEFLAFCVSHFWKVLNLTWLPGTLPSLSMRESTEVSSSNAPCYLEPCLAFVLVPWSGFDRRKDFCAVFMGRRAVGGGGGLSLLLEPVLERTV